MELEPVHERAPVVAVAGERVTLLGGRRVLLGGRSFGPEPEQRRRLVVATELR